MKNVAAAAKSPKANPVPPPDDDRAPASTAEPPDDDRAPASTAEPPASKAPASGTRPAARRLSRPVEVERRTCVSQDLRQAIEDLHFAAVTLACNLDLTEEQVAMMREVEHAFVDGIGYVRYLEDEVAKHRSNAREAQHLLFHEIQRQREYATSLVGGG